MEVSEWPSQVARARLRPADGVAESPLAGALSPSCDSLAFVLFGVMASVSALVTFLEPSAPSGLDDPQLIALLGSHAPQRKATLWLLHHPHALLSLLARPASPSCRTPLLLLAAWMASLCQPRPFSSQRSRAPIRCPSPDDQQQLQLQTSVTAASIAQDGVSFGRTRDSTGCWPARATAVGLLAPPARYQPSTQLQRVSLKVGSGSVGDGQDISTLPHLSHYRLQAPSGPRLPVP